MSAHCEHLHRVMEARSRYPFDLPSDAVPLNGISLLFEEGERAHGGSRIVWIGTHTKADRLPHRLQDHLRPNKDGSILRKSIGSALLASRRDPYAEAWKLDTSARAQRLDPRVDEDRQREIEEKVTEYIRSHLSFAVLAVETAADRAFYQPKLIATVAQCSGCGPSERWLGRSSPREKIRSSGLWQVQHVGGPTFTAAEHTDFVERILTG